MECVVGVARFREYSVLTVVERTTSVLGKLRWTLPHFFLDPNPSQTVNCARVETKLLAYTARE
jgi:hypothetical protein